jgi:hypothetical protein
MTRPGLVRRRPAFTELDNLKAAVLKADWFDPESNPKMG